MTRPPAELTEAKRRLIERLTRLDSATAPELAVDFGITDTAARQHLESLEALGFVERTAPDTQGRGRPAVQWRTTTAAHELFPDRHRELAADLIASVRDTLGADALDRLIDARTERQRDRYRQEIGPTNDVSVRVRRLAELRSGEGYMAEVRDHDGGWLLVEHHCPICDAAAACQGFCRAEMELFRDAIGAQATVTRTQHVLSGDARCAYVISPA